MAAKIIPDLDLAERVESGLAALRQKRADDAEKKRQLDAELAERERLATLAVWEQQAAAWREHAQEWTDTVTAVIERLEELGRERRALESHAAAIYRGSDACGAIIGLSIKLSPELFEKARQL
jgi:hypothetical protein